MDIKLTKPFAANSKATESDTRAVKRALNRLGYYIPSSKTGMTSIPDRAVFTALKEFQDEQGLTPTATMKPGDKTLEALNTALDAADPKSFFIWSTMGDERVRPEHKALEGAVLSWDGGITPAQDPGCRCWALPVAALTAKTNCDEEKEKYEELQEKVKELSERFNDLLLRLQELIDEGKRLVANAQKSLGGQVVPYILTLPFERLGVLSELLRRNFGNIISNELLQGADSFMKQFWAVKQKAQYVKDQRDIVFAQLERVVHELEEAKKRLEECEKNQE